MRQKNLSKKSKNPRITRTIKRITKYEKIRFILVGGLNTTVDFAVLIILVSVLGVPTFMANIVSTSVALAVSYTLNKKAVFGNTDKNNQQLILFIIVTLFGLWILQSLTINFTSSLLSGWIGISATSAIILVTAKLLATFISLTWNYLWYSKVIFSQKKPTKQ